MPCRQKLFRIIILLEKMRKRKSNGNNSILNVWTCILTIKKKSQKLHKVSNWTPIYTMIPISKIYHIEFDYYTSSQENNKWRYIQSNHEHTVIPVGKEPHHEKRHWTLRKNTLNIVHTHWHISCTDKNRQNKPYSLI